VFRLRPADAVGGEPEANGRTRRRGLPRLEPLLVTGLRPATEIDTETESSDDERTPSA
jgi:hypothetical protein